MVDEAHDEVTRGERYRRIANQRRREREAGAPLRAGNPGFSESTAPEVGQNILASAGQLAYAQRTGRNIEVVRPTAEKWYNALPEKDRNNIPRDQINAAYSTARTHALSRGQQEVDRLIRDGRLPAGATFAGWNTRGEGQIRTPREGGRISTDAGEYARMVPQVLPISGTLVDAKEYSENPSGFNFAMLSGGALLDFTTIGGIAFRTARRAVKQATTKTTVAGSTARVATDSGSTRKTTPEGAGRTDEAEGAAEGAARTDEAEGAGRTDEAEGRRNPTDPEPPAKKTTDPETATKKKSNLGKLAAAGVVARTVTLGGGGGGAIAGGGGGGGGSRRGGSAATTRCYFTRPIRSRIQIIQRTVTSQGTEEVIIGTVGSQMELLAFVRARNLRRCPR